MSNGTKALAGDLRTLAESLSAKAKESRKKAGSLPYFGKENARAEGSSDAYGDAATQLSEIIKRHKLCPKQKAEPGNNPGSSLNS